MKRVYTPFGLQQKKDIFVSISRFAHINRPIKGMYMEFGCHGAITIGMAWECFHHMFDWEYYCFDSFEGLPEIDEIDEMKIWEKGKLKTSEEEFRQTAASYGIPKDQLHTVKGFYENSLTPELKKQLAGKKAAVVYVDCDLYASTIPVLNFAKDFLQVGTIIVFDDWFCFHGDPDRGERKAFREFREANPSLHFEEFVRNSESCSFVYVGCKSDPMASPE